MEPLFYASLLVAGIAGSLWLAFGRHAEPWAPSGPDPAALDSPEAIATLLRLATEAHQATKPDEVVRLMGWLFAELPAAELRAMVHEQGRAWLEATRPRLSQTNGAIVTAALDDAAAAAANRDFAAGRQCMLTVLQTLKEQAFAHPGAALIAAGMNGAWAREHFGAAAAGV
jgi:hypothetical protein